MIKLRDDGLVRSIGVSNFTPTHLDRLSTETGVAPLVNQIELHPYFPQPEMRVADEERGVLTQAWRPLGRGGELLAAPPIADAAARHGRTPAQVVLRWHIQLGAVADSEVGHPRADERATFRSSTSSCPRPKWTPSPGSPGVGWGPATPTRTRSSEPGALAVAAFAGHEPGRAVSRAGGERPARR